MELCLCGTHSNSQIIFVAMLCQKILGIFEFSFSIQHILQLVQRLPDFLESKSTIKIYFYESNAITLIAYLDDVSTIIIKTFVQDRK